MTARRGTMSSSLTPPMPPGATGPAARGTASSSNSKNYANISLNAMLNAPSRLSQPRLHPDKVNGALWFGIDPSVNKFVRSTWQGYFMGPWRNWSKVPEERKQIWWQTFVQQYYWESQFNDLVHFHWKKETMTTICERISTKKRNNGKPNYIGETDWNTLLVYWATAAAQKKSRDAAASRKSDPEKKGVAKHNAGPVAFIRIEHNMKVAAGDKPISYIDLVRRTHTRKDGTFVDYRAEELVTQVEKEVAELMDSDESPNETNPTATSAPSQILINQAYLKHAKPKKGLVYGLGSAQFRDFNPTIKVPGSLKRSLDMEFRMSGVETTLESVTTDVSGIKQDVSATRDMVAQFIQSFGAHMTTSTSAQASAPQAPVPNAPSVDPHAETATSQGNANNI